MTRKIELTLAVSRPQPTTLAPRIFRPDVVQRLSASNRGIRWLRRHGVTAVEVEVMNAQLPTVIVPPSAAQALRQEAYRKGLRCLTDNAGGTVFWHDCAVTWRI